MKDQIIAVAGDVERNFANITKVLEDVAEVKDDVAAVQGDVQRNSADITTLGVRGHWCAEQEGPWRTVGTITYDNIFFSDSNMNITDTPLDINTGINTL